MMGNETKQKFYFFFLPSWYDVVIRLFFLHWNGKLTSTMLYAPTQLHSQYFTFHLQRTTQKQQEEIWVLIFSHSLLTFHQFHSGWRWIFCNFFFVIFEFYTLRCSHPQLSQHRNILSCLQMIQKEHVLLYVNCK